MVVGQGFSLDRTRHRGDEENFNSNIQPNGYEETDSAESSSLIDGNETRRDDNDVTVSPDLNTNDNTTYLHNKI